jgi:hypothetical protein
MLPTVSLSTGNWYVPTGSILIELRWLGDKSIAGIAVVELAVEALPDGGELVSAALARNGCSR